MFIPVVVQSLCKSVDPGLVPAVQLLQRAEVRLRSPTVLEQHQHHANERQQQQQQQQQKQHHAVAVTPEDEAIAIRIMLAWLQHSLSGSSSTSSTSSSTTSTETSSPAGDAATAPAAQGEEGEHGRGDGAPDLIASLLSQLRDEVREEQRAGGTADRLRPFLETARQQGARFDLRDLRALSPTSLPGGEAVGGEWTAALEAAEEGDQDMHDVSKRRWQCTWGPS